MITGEYKPGQGYSLRQTVSATAANNPNRDVNGQPTTNQSQMLANDPVAGKTVWTRDWKYANQVPVLATSADLLFPCGNDSGVFRALNAKDGKDAWSFKFGSRCRQSPITYTFGGKQFSAVIASSAANNTAVAAPDDANRYRRSGSTLYVFKLPG